MSVPDRIATKATELRPARVLLTILAAPLYVLGFLVGLLWVAVLWLVAAAAVGFADARTRGRRES